MAALRTLVAQAEATKPHGDRWWFGYEIFEFNGQFRLVIHTSTYDGVKRDSHHATPEQAMEALTREDALSEAARTTAAYARAVTGVEG
jgi:hypothetical protein